MSITPPNGRSSVMALAPKYARLRAVLENSAKNVEGGAKTARSEVADLQRRAIEANAAGDTFAKLLREHAVRRGRRPAFRHKDLGLWQTWTWAEVYDETRAIAAGLLALGLDRGDTMAIVGANRPKLYWSITAAQMIGAIPVPVYADSDADELAIVLDHAEVTAVVAQDQEQVDKILAVRGRLPRVHHILYDEPRGLGDYDEPGFMAFEAVVAKGRAALADGNVAADLDPRIDAGRGADPSVILYTSGTTGRSKGVVLSGERSIAAARDTVAFDKLTDRDEGRWCTNRQHAAW